MVLTLQPKTEAATKANKYELTSSYRITELIRLFTVMYLQSFLQKSNLPRSTHLQKELQTRHWKIWVFLYLLKPISQQVQLHIPHTVSNPWPCAIPPTTSKKHCLHCQEHSQQMHLQKKLHKPRRSSRVL